MARMPYTAPAGIKSAYATVADGKVSDTEVTDGKPSTTGSGHGPAICCVRNPKG